MGKDAFVWCWVRCLPVLRQCKVHRPPLRSHPPTIASLLNRSLLWMAPEALRGSPIKECHALSLDVYSYAIVLWEIWTRARPWDEVKEDGVHFAVKLAELVGAGVRPRRPSDCAPAPEGFQLLMESCWVGEPGERPTFGDILARLGDVGANLATRTSSL